MGSDSMPTFSANLKEVPALTDADLTRKLRSLERAKATHLVRQLQVRLQYAKLKVDHGWQKQRLNEVENLYFRQQRHPDTSGKPEYYLAPLDAQLLPYQGDPAPGASSSLSFGSGYPPMDASTSGMEFLRDSPGPANESANGNGNGSAAWASDSASHAGPSTSTTTQFFGPPLPHPHPDAASPWLQLRTHNDSVPPPQGTTSSAASPLKKPFVPPAATLTYDSFWSSHAPPALPDSTATAQVGSAAGYTPTAGYTYTPAAMSAPRSVKGKGRVSEGGIVKRKSPIVQASLQLAGPG
ncbi:hypothetical protein FB451DRAFT_1287935 [Mycena latifolia]|nr:hypothetical protein FB451DRAFT_1287935 [Mycena latifolia]